METFRTLHGGTLFESTGSVELARILYPIVRLMHP